MEMAFMDVDALFMVAIDSQTTGNAVVQKTYFAPIKRERTTRSKIRPMLFQLKMTSKCQV